MDNDRFDGLTKAIAEAASRRSMLKGAAAGAAGAVLALVGVAQGDDLTAEAKRSKKKKNKKNKKNNKKKKTICHCGSNDPSTCNTIRVSEEARRQHLQHHCDYDGECQPDVAGRCTPPITGCTRDSDCGGNTPFCQNRTCVQCRNNGDCRGAAAGDCVNGACIPGFAICTKPASLSPVTPGGASVTFVTAPDSPPPSAGSAEFEVGSDGRDWAHLRNGLFAGSPLSGLEVLEYTTYEPTGSICGMAPYMVLYVTSIVGGVDILLFDPGVGPAVVGQPDPVCDAFQIWNARAGLWRSIFHPEFAPQNNPQLLDDYESEFGPVTLRNQDPNATECPGVVGGIRLEVGENNPGQPTGGWQNFVGFVDSFHIKFAGQSERQYDF